MRFFKPNRGETHLELVLELRKQLEKKYERLEQGPNIPFIHPDDARSVMTRERVRDLLSPFRWYREDERTKIWQTMNLILCTLVSIPWRDWNSFVMLFCAPGHGLELPRFMDSHLPVSEEVLGPLPQDLKAEFLRHQYIFSPVIFKQHSHQIFKQHQPLPITKVERIDAQGAQGDVDKVHIAARYLIYTDTGNSVNAEARVMARKTIRAERHNFDTEKRVLEHFKSCLGTNRNIMQSFASFVHGSKFIILSPWAEGGDLHQFLYRPDKSVESYPTRSRHFSPYNLLIEAHNLAQALRFLHEEMHTANGKYLRCAHLDLKPENILVCFPPNQEIASCPVGIWKIGDFGLSKVEERVAGSRVVPLPRDEQDAAFAPGNVLREASFQPVKRGAGPFQPPEVQSKETAKVSTRRDVWSFGCILAMVFAFALGGPNEVINQLQLRTGGDDFFYQRTSRHSRPPISYSPLYSDSIVSAEIKRPIRSWLEHDVYGLVLEEHRSWVAMWSELIVKLLTTDVIHRPEIGTAIRGLSGILDYTNGWVTERLWSFEEVSRISEDDSWRDAPELDLRSETVDSGRPFVGIPSLSHRSSDTPITPSRRNGFGSIVARSFRPDSSLAFSTLGGPGETIGVSLGSSANSALVWNASRIHVYDLSLLDNPTFWRDTPQERSTNSQQSVPSPAQSIQALNQSRCVKVLASGSFIAVVELQAVSSEYTIRIFAGQQANSLQYAEVGRIPLRTKPHDVKLSAKGMCMVRHASHLDLYSHIGRTSIALSDKDFLAFEFSHDGTYFCLWETDNPETSPNGKMNHFWTVWQANETFDTVGGTMSYKHEEWNYRVNALSDMNSYLMPFHCYSRFIAVDKQMNVYLVRADLESNRVERLGVTARILAGLVLPEDESFLMVRASKSGRRTQRVERFVLNSINTPTAFTPIACGDMYIERQNGIRSYTVGKVGTMSDTPCLLALEESGLLVRKLL